VVDVGDDRDVAQIVSGCDSGHGSGSRLCSRMRSRIEAGVPRDGALRSGGRAVGGRS
jgi:hypothetical protein